MLPRYIKPMLAAPATTPFDSEDYCFEIKWDGIRCLAFVENGNVRLQSRELVDITRAFPELADLARLPNGTVLDGELVIFEDAGPCRSHVLRRLQLQNKARISILSAERPASFVAFDLLYHQGRSTMREPLGLRRRRLEEVLGLTKIKNCLLSEAVRGKGRELLERVSELGWEGIVAKRLDGHYSPGRRVKEWAKSKCATHGS